VLGQRLSNDASDATICPYWAKRRIRPQGATGNTRADEASERMLKKR
jgi:hypothetical protein